MKIEGIQRRSLRNDLFCWFLGATCPLIISRRHHQQMYRALLGFARGGIGGFTTGIETGCDSIDAYFMGVCLFVKVLYLIRFGFFVLWLLTFFVSTFLCLVWSFVTR